MKTKNAKITAASLSRGASESLIVDLSLTYGGGDCQGFSLGYIYTAKTPTVNAFRLYELLEVCGVESFDKVVGSYVIAHFDDNGYVTRLEHILENDKITTP